MLSPLFIIWTNSAAAELQVGVDDFQVVQMNPEDGVLRLTVTGEVDLATAGPLRDAAEVAAQSGNYSWIVFDLAGVTFMDSTGMHILADTNRLMRAAGGKVEVLCSAPLRRLFGVMGLDRVFSINPESHTDDLVAA